jgi:hypothetical protein
VKVNAVRGEFMRQCDSLDGAVDGAGHGSGTNLEVSGAGRTMPLCSYPAYPKYLSGPLATASSYACSAPN